MVIKKNLNEDTLAQAVKQDAVDHKVHDVNNLEYVLDRAYQANINKKRREDRGQRPSGWINVLITGGAGIGKTARVEQWAENKGLKFVNHDCQSMDPADLGGAVAPDRETGKRAIKLGSDEFNSLDFYDEEDHTYSVLFLDEFNRAPSDVRGTLLTLINNHKVPDSAEKSHRRYLPGMLFTVVAINPGGADYNTDVLDAAERSRFYIVDMKASNKDSLDYLIKQYKGDLSVEDDPEEIQRIKGRLNLAMTLLKSKQFVFDDDQDEAIAQENQTNILNPRSLTQAIDMSDGTKKDFLDWWNGMCNPNKRGVMETILANYKDIDNKANSVFKNKNSNSSDDGDASIFKKKEPSAYDKFSSWKRDNGY